MSIKDRIRAHYGLPPETVIKTTINIWADHEHPDITPGTWYCEDAPEAAALQKRAVAALKEKGWRKLPWILTIDRDILVKDGTEVRIMTWTREEDYHPEREKRIRDSQPPFPY